MKRATAFLAAIAIWAVCSTSFAVWEVSDAGIWPESWPKAMEPLRMKSSTIRGSQMDLVIHHIPFTKRDEFDAAWPQLLEVKTKGAPIILVRSPGTHWHFGKSKAGVLVHCPPGGVDPIRLSHAGRSQASKFDESNGSGRPTSSLLSMARSLT